MADKENQLNAYSNYFQGGLDTVSIPCMALSPKKESIGGKTGEATISENEGFTKSPLMINILAKEREGLKRREGLKAFPNSTLTNIMGMSVDTASQDSFVISKNANGSYTLSRIFKENGTIVSSSEFSLPNTPQLLNFKVVTRYPSTTNNIFIFATDEKGNLYNLVTTFINGVFSTVKPNDVLTSTGITGPLNVIDKEESNRRLFLLIETAGQYKVIFGNNVSNLDNSYTLPASVRPTALFSLGRNLFVGTASEILAIEFDDNYTSTSPIYRYANNVGVKNAFSYQLVGTFAYCYGESAFYSLELTTRRELSMDNTIVQFIDMNISNISSILFPSNSFYHASDKMIGWICNIDSIFIYKALHMFARDIQGYKDSWDVYYADNYKKNKFILLYSIEKNSWFLNFYEEEVRAYQNFNIKVVDKYCNSIVATNKGIYVAHRDYYLDGDKDFPVLFMPRIKNWQILAGRLSRAQRVSISYSNNDEYTEKNGDKELLITACNSYLNKNIIHETPNNIFSDITNISKSSLYSISTYQYHLNLTGIAPNCVIALSSKAVHSIVGVLVIEHASGVSSI